MTTSSARAAEILAARNITDEAFLEATALLASRLGVPLEEMEAGVSVGLEGSQGLAETAPRGEPGDLRSDPEAPALLFNWFRHVPSRVPDLRVWGLSAQIEGFFDPASGRELPEGWGWDCRDRVLALNEALRSRAAWVPDFESAVEEAHEAVRRWLDSLALGA